MVITGDLFKLHLRPLLPTATGIYLVVATETRTVGKRAVRILLEFVLGYSKCLVFNFKLQARREGEEVSSSSSNSDNDDDDSDNSGEDGNEPPVSCVQS